PTSAKLLSGLKVWAFKEFKNKSPKTKERVFISLSFKVSNAISRIGTNSYYTKLLFQTYKTKKYKTLTFDNSIISKYSRS
ncbi:MAG TPA: hypothetical protein PKZ91_02680, partial [Saprospiraceae bacterium]|nr:hypothetical protein [Saprospiraceae bacterium]